MHCQLSGPRRTWLVWVLFLVATFLVTGCRLLDDGPEPTDVSNDGSVVLWHTWQGADELALNDLITRFESLYPRVRLSARHPL